jgi:Ubiquitinol-cytochrome C reductase Fe-S subunit TAT signal
MNRRSRHIFSSRRDFLRTAAGAIAALGTGAHSSPSMFAVEGAMPTITPDGFRRPEQRMLTMLGNPTEAATIDLVDLAKAWDRAVAGFAARGVHLWFPRIPVTKCWKGENQYDFRQWKLSSSAR